MNNERLERLLRLLRAKSNHAYDMRKSFDDKFYIGESLAYDDVINCISDTQYMEKMENIFIKQRNGE